MQKIILIQYFPLNQSCLLICQFARVWCTKRCYVLKSFMVKHYKRHKKVGVYTAIKANQSNKALFFNDFWCKCTKTRHLPERKREKTSEYMFCEKAFLWFLSMDVHTFIVYTSKASEYELKHTEDDSPVVLTIKITTKNKGFTFIAECLWYRFVGQEKKGTFSIHHHH